MSVNAYHVANHNLALARARGGTSWNGLASAFCRLHVLLDTTHGCSNGSSPTRVRDTTASSSIASGGRAALGGEDLIQRLIKLSGHFEWCLWFGCFVGMKLGVERSVRDQFMKVDERSGICDTRRVDGWERLG
jgi:hypothetical protein